MRANISLASVGRAVDNGRPVVSRITFSLIVDLPLWYLAGRAIDGLLREKSSRQHMPAFVSASREFLLIASGV